MDIELIKNYNLRFDYLPITNNESIEKITNLILNKELFEPTDAVEMYYLASYYYKQKNMIMTKKYLKMAIKLECTEAMVAISRFYYKSHKDKSIQYLQQAAKLGNTMGCLYLAEIYEKDKQYDLMVDTYLVAIEHGDSTAMCHLANYYFKNKKYELMEKYHLMAIDHHHILSMVSYGYYCGKIEKKYVRMEHYYLMAIQTDSPYQAYSESAMYYLAEYYNRIKKMEDMEKYALMFLKYNLIPKLLYMNDIVVEMLSKYYNTIEKPVSALHLYIEYKSERPKIIKQFNHISSLILNEEQYNLLLTILTTFEFGDDLVHSSIRMLSNVLRNQIDIMDLHFKYTVNGIGYEKAKEEFLQSL